APRRSTTRSPPAEGPDRPGGAAPAREVGSPARPEHRPRSARAVVRARSSAEPSRDSGAAAIERSLLGRREGLGVVRSARAETAEAGPRECVAPPASAAPAPSAPVADRDPPRAGRRRAPAPRAPAPRETLTARAAADRPAQWRAGCASTLIPTTSPAATAAISARQASCGAPRWTTTTFPRAAS